MVQPQLSSLSHGQNSVPKLTPIRLAFTLALELFTRAAHSAAALRAHAIQNGGDHFCSHLDVAFSRKRHEHLTNEIE